MDLMTYEDVHAALSGREVEEATQTVEAFANWLLERGIEPEAIKRNGFDLGHVAIKAMRDREQTLLEALISMFASGIVAAYSLIERATAADGERPPEVPDGDR